MFFVNQSVFFLACVFSEPLSMGKLSKLRYPIAKPVSRQGVAILGGCFCFKLGGCYQFFVLNCLVAWKNLRDPGKICFSPVTLLLFRCFSDFDSDALYKVYFLVFTNMSFEEVVGHRRLRDCTMITQTALLSTQRE